jgi:signal transduction histidine kinase
VSDAALRRFGAVIAGLNAVLFVCALVFLVLDLRAVPDPFTAQAPWFINLLITTALGMLIINKRPRNAVGWLLLAIGAGNALYLPADFIGIFGLLHGASHTGWVAWCAWLFNWTGGAGAALLVALAIFFPTGRLPSRAWRPVVATAFIVGAFDVVLSMLLMDTGSDAVQLAPSLPSIANPIGVLSDQFTPVVALLPAPLLALALGPIVVRYRRSTGVERRQMQWFARVAATTLLSVVLLVVTGVLFAAVLPAANTAAGFAFDLGLGVLLPGTIGLAVIRYGLYDIDVFISRAVVYGSLAVFITVVYIAIAVGIGAAAGSGGKPNVGLSIVATVIVALGFQPVRERLQRVANRMVYGQRATPYEVLTEFSARAAQTYDAADVLPRMARVLQAGTGAEVATVWLRRGGELTPEAMFPDEFAGYEPAPIRGDELPDLVAVSRAVPVRHEQHLLGALSIVKRRGESLTPIEQSLMDELAGQAGLVLRNVSLTAELRQRLDELRDSRQRLVSAQDDERRRLERNLHDGAQQYLVAIKMKLGLADSLAVKNPEQAATMLEQLKGDADEALETLRDLARGIYPPLLADKGLVAALESQARKATLPVAVEHGEVGRYSQDVEATVYFCVLEALQNVQKYARAAQVTVRVADFDGRLRFSVTDDGAGFDSSKVQRGAGLTNMHDRIDSLGGSVRVVSSPGHGTVVSGELPVAARNTAREALAVAV